MASIVLKFLLLFVLVGTFSITSCQLGRDTALLGILGVSPVFWSRGFLGVAVIMCCVKFLQYDGVFECAVFYAWIQLVYHHRSTSEVWTVSYLAAYAVMRYHLTFQSPVTWGYVLYLVRAAAVVRLLQLMEREEDPSVLRRTYLCAATVFLGLQCSWIFFQTLDFFF